MDVTREPEYGCLYHGECLMGRGLHYRSQCHIPSTFTAPETPEAPGGRPRGAEPATRGAELSRRPTPTPGQGAPAARDRRPHAPSEPRNPEAAGTKGTDQENELRTDRQRHARLLREQGLSWTAIGREQRAQQAANPAADRARQRRYALRS